MIECCSGGDLGGSRGLVRAGVIFCRLVSTSLSPREIRRLARAKIVVLGTRDNCHGILHQGGPCSCGGACLVYLVYLGKRPDRQSGINGDFTTRNICTLCSWYLRNTRRLHGMLGRSLTASQQHSTAALINSSPASSETGSSGRCPSALKNRCGIHSESSNLQYRSTMFARRQEAGYNVEPRQILHTSGIF